MKPKIFNYLFLFALFGTALWFFGNLYEAIVIGPNIMADSLERLHHFQSLFVGGNPALFYVPVTPLATISLLAVYFLAPKQNPALRRLLKFSLFFQLSAWALSAYIIPQINFKIFFGDLDKYAADVHYYAVLWNILNGIRVILVGFSLGFFFSAYVKWQVEMDTAGIGGKASLQK